MEELGTLSLESNYKSTLKQVEGVSGLYFYLDKSKSESEKIFLPAAGMLKVEAFNDPIFCYKDASCVYWSSTKQNYLNAYYLISSANNQSYSIVYNRKENAASVRCVRDVQ